MLNCAGCGLLPDGLYAVLSPKRRLCLKCWKKAGEPWPKPQRMTAAQLHAHEEQTRRKMLARGGADAHAVRAGRS